MPVRIEEGPAGNGVPPRSGPLTPTPSSRGSSPESSGSENRQRRRPRRPKRRLSSDSSNKEDVTPTSQTPLKMTKVGEGGMSEEPSSSPVGSDGESLISVVTEPRSGVRRGVELAPPGQRPEETGQPSQKRPSAQNCAQFGGKGGKKEPQGSTFQPTQRTRGSQLRGPLVGASSSKEPGRQPLWNTPWCCTTSAGVPHGSTSSDRGTAASSSPTS